MKQAYSGKPPEGSVLSWRAILAGTTTWHNVDTGAETFWAGQIGAAESTPGDFKLTTTIEEGSFPRHEIEIVQRPAKIGQGAQMQRMEIWLQGEDLIVFDDAWLKRVLRIGPQLERLVLIGRGMTRTRRA